jgi:hypothetical protein
MGQEILYTSAPQGLRPGASGYCTVCSTAGMEPNLAEFLEGFSGYPHPFKPPDPRTRDNPVNYSHIHWTIGGQRFHVLSRVCDAGLDYTGRTNLLAHHVALTRREVERLPGGPAWVMSAEGFFYTQWDGQLRTIPGQKPRTDDVPLSRCMAWERAAGDAGYAGLLAAAALEKGRPVIVIYPAGMETLPLVVEAQSLLPPERRWNVTFTTFSSRIYSSFDVQWRFLFGETADARTARRDPHALVIDLCSGPLPAAAGGALVTAAREGRLASQPAAPSRSPREAPASSGRSRRPTAPMSVGAGDLRMLPPELLPDGLGALPVNEGNTTASPFERSRKKQRSAWLHYSLAFVGGIALTLVFFVLLAMSGDDPKPIAQLPAAPQQGVLPESEDDASKEQGKPSESKPVEVIDNPDEFPTAENPTPAEPVPVEASPPSATPPMDLPTPQEMKAPFAEFPGDLFELPQRKSSGGLSATDVAKPAPVRIYARPPESLKLQLLGKQFVFGSDEAVELKAETEGQDWVWIVSRKRTSGLQRLGRFRLKDDSLTFAWENSIPESAQPDLLRFCLLEISVGEGNAKVCRLSKPYMVEAIRLGELPAMPIALKNLDPSNFASVKELKFEFKVKGLDNSIKRSPDSPIALGESQKVLINGAGERDEGPRAGLLAEFQVDEADRKQGTIRIRSKVAFKDATIDDVQSLEMAPDSHTLISTAIKDELKEAQKKIAGFKLKLARGETTTKERRDNLANKEKRAELERNVEKYTKLVMLTNGEAQKRAQGDLDEARTKRDKFIEFIEGPEKSAKQEFDAANKTVAKWQSQYDLITHLSDKGRFEYRIFFKINEVVVELYRTKGFDN